MGVRSGFLVPKILKMPQPKVHRKPDDAPVAHDSERPNVLPFPGEEEDGLDTISRWVSLADQVLGSGKLKKKA